MLLLSRLDGPRTDVRPRMLHGKRDLLCEAIRPPEMNRALLRERSIHVATAARWEGNTTLLRPHTHKGRGTARAPMMRGHTASIFSA
jgi:hypothetical protein